MKEKYSRTEMAGRNVMWAYIGNVILTVTKFISRWAFLQTIGSTYLGINGLYTSILQVLSLTELGVGTAMSYSLYRPVAYQDIVKIKSLMQFYKKAYRIIAAVITILGLTMVPFLPFLLKGAEEIDHLTLYYLIFLFNTVSSYFVSYKYSLNAAEQKAYIVNNISAVMSVLMSIVQVAVLFLFHSFLGYLLVQSGCLLIEKLYTSFYLDRQYPYLKEDAEPLDKETKLALFSDLKSLTIHKLGDVAVNQTDNIIISSCINVATTGLISNYVLVTSTVGNFLNIMFNNITGSLGNLCVSSDLEHRFTVYKIYDFMSFWLFGFSAIAYTALIQPFTELMWGAEYIVDSKVIILIIINTYIVGQRIPLNNMKVASGLFSEDKYLPLIQAIINLAVSLVLVYTNGLIGVYIGTIVSGLVPTFIRPVMVYKKMFGHSSVDYFKMFFRHSIMITVVGATTVCITSRIMVRLNWGTFIASMLVTGIVPNLILLTAYRKTNEFIYLKNLVIRLAKKIKEKI